MTPADFNPGLPKQPPQKQPQPPISNNDGAVTKYAGVNCGPGFGELPQLQGPNPEILENQYQKPGMPGFKPQEGESIMNNINSTSATKYAGVSCGGGALNDLDKEQLLDFINQEQNKQTDIQEKLAEQPQKKIKE